MALTSDGSIVSWGGDYYDDYYGVVSGTPTDTGFQAIAAGEHISMALRSDGSIISWGYDYANVVSDTPIGTGFTAIAAGSYHSMALRSNGSIVSWGDDYYDQVSGTPSGTGFTAIAAGEDISMALRSNGSIVSWGWDNWDQVSDTPTDTGFTAIAAGGYKSMALPVPGLCPEADPCWLNEEDEGCNTADLDSLYAVFNTSVPPTDAVFDLNFDNVVDAADLSEWLSLAATENGHGSPYLRGDTDLDRDIDLTDYNRLATNFDPIGTYAPYLWQDGNFDGNGNVDLGDYNALTANFKPLGYGAAPVPEPSSIVLVIAGLLAATGARCWRH